MADFQVQTWNELGNLKEKRKRVTHGEDKSIFSISNVLSFLSREKLMSRSTGFSFLLGKNRMLETSVTFDYLPIF